MSGAGLLLVLGRKSRGEPVTYEECRSLVAAGWARWSEEDARFVITLAGSTAYLSAPHAAVGYAR